MLRRRNKPEEIVAALRQVDLLLSLVASIADAMPDWRERGDVLSLAARIQWAETRADQAAEGAGARE